MSVNEKNIKGSNGICNAIALAAVAAFLLAVLVVLGSRESLATIYESGQGNYGAASGSWSQANENSIFPTIGNTAEKNFTIEGKWKNIGGFKWLAGRSGLNHCF